MNVCVCVCVCSVVSDSLQPHGVSPCNFPDKNTGVGCHFLQPGDLLNPGIEPKSLASPALAGRFFTTVPPGKHNIKRGK